MQKNRRNTFFSDQFCFPIYFTHKETDGVIKIPIKSENMFNHKLKACQFKDVGVASICLLTRARRRVLNTDMKKKIVD